MLLYRLQISIADFDILRRVGEGSFSTVLLARYQGDGKLYALKMINKSLVLRNKVPSACYFDSISCFLLVQQVGCHGG